MLCLESQPLKKTFENRPEDLIWVANLFAVLDKSVVRSFEETNIVILMYFLGFVCLVYSISPVKRLSNYRKVNLLLHYLYKIRFEAQVINVLSI